MNEEKCNSTWCISCAENIIHKNEILQKIEEFIEHIEFESDYEDALYRLHKELKQYKKFLEEEE